MIASSGLCRNSSLLLCLFFLAPFARATPEWLPVTPAELSEDKPRIEPEAAVEILDFQLKLDDHGLIRRFTRRMRYKIYDPARATEATRIDRFWLGNKRVRYELAARLTLPDGTSREFRRTDVQQRSVAELGNANGFLGWLLTDRSARVQEQFLAITGVTKGAVLDVWEYEPEIPIREWLKQPIQQVGIPIRHFDFEIRYAVDEDLAHRFYVLNGHGGKTTDDKAAHRIHFTAENLPSIVHESFGPPTSYYSLTLIDTYEILVKELERRHIWDVPLPKNTPPSAGPWASYATVKDFFDTDHGFPTARAKAKAAELTQGATDDRARAQRIYAYVQSQFQRFRRRADLQNWYRRYVRDVDELIQLDQIDTTLVEPKDFHYLFVALLHAAGFECHTACHPSRESFPFSPDLVSRVFVPFESVLVKIGNDWVDCAPCTDVPLRFGEIPWDASSQPALLAQPQKQVFMMIPALPAEKSSVEGTGDLTLDLEGNLSGEYTRTYSGHAAQEVREQMDEALAEDWPALARKLLGLHSSGADVRILAVEGIDRPDDLVRIRAAIRWPAYAPTVGSRMLFAPAVFNQGVGPKLVEAERHTPVFFRYPRRDKDTLRIHLPPGVKAAGNPKPISVSNPDYSYLLAITATPGTSDLVVEREAICRIVTLPVEEYPRLYDWFHRQSAADQITLMLQRSDAPATPAKKL